MGDLAIAKLSPRSHAISLLSAVILLAAPQLASGEPDAPAAAEPKPEDPKPRDSKLPDSKPEEPKPEYSEPQDTEPEDPTAIELAGARPSGRGMEARIVAAAAQRQAKMGQDPAELGTCEPGSLATCFCASGEGGTSVCSKGNRFGSCTCAHGNFHDGSRDGKIIAVVILSVIGWPTAIVGGAILLAGLSADERDREDYFTIGGIVATSGLGIAASGIVVSQIDFGRRSTSPGFPPARLPKGPSVRLGPVSTVTWSF